LAGFETSVLGVPLGEILLISVLIIVGGVFAGVLAGLFGIGGGGIIVPVLYEVFRALDVPEQVRMQLCIGTSLAIIVPTTVRSYRAHRAKGAVIPHVVRTWAAPAIAGVVVGAVTAAFAPGSVFKIAFVVFTILSGIKLLFGPADWKLAEDLPGRGAMIAYGVLVGLSSSLIGVSGGTVSNMVLTLYGKTMLHAVATSAGLGVPITIVGTIGYMIAGLPHQNMLPPLSLGFVSLSGLVLMAPVSSFVAPYGARLAHWLPKRHLEIAFGLFLLLVAVRFIVSLI
jgi:uncharacterized membrane protein YfcA